MVLKYRYGNSKGGQMAGFQFWIEKFNIHLFPPFHKTAVVSAWLHITPFLIGCQHYRSSVKKKFIIYFLE